MSTRLNTRFSSRLISRTSQSACTAQQRVGGEHVAPDRPGTEHQQAEVGSFRRRCSSASSSSRAIASGQKFAPAA